MSPPAWAIPHSIRNVSPLLAVYIVLLEPGQLTGVAVGDADELEVEDVVTLVDDVLDVTLVELVLLDVVVAEAGPETSFAPQMPAFEVPTPRLDFR